MAVGVGLAVGQRFISARAGDTAANAAAGARHDLADAIVAAWRSQVDDDLARQPLTESELAEVEQSDGPLGREAVESSPRLAYGTTLLVAVVAARWVVLLQVGDGDILLVSRAGATSRPLPRDPRLLGNETTSLSAPRAQEDVRTAAVPVGPDGPALAVLASDGFANAYADDAAFLQVGPDLLAHVRASGVKSVAERLEAWLETASRHDGDDVTVVMVAFEGADEALAGVPTPGAGGRRP
jgi:serine/threonine protein phosphatase PrpC